MTNSTKEEVRNLVKTGDAEQVLEYIEFLEEEAYDAGKDSGYSDGYDEGYDEGYAEGCDVATDAATKGASE